MDRGTSLRSGLSPLRWEPGAQTFLREETPLHRRGFCLLASGEPLWQIFLCAFLLAAYLAAAAFVLRTDVLAFTARGLDSGHARPFARALLHLPYAVRFALAAVPAVGAAWVWWRASLRRGFGLRASRHDDEAAQKDV